MYTHVYILSTTGGAFSLDLGRALMSRKGPAPKVLEEPSLGPRRDFAPEPLWEALQIHKM